MSCKDITPNSWHELIDELFKDCTLQERIQKYRSPYAYRGLSDKNHELKTSLIRLHDKNRECCRKVEPHILKNFTKYSREDNSSFTEWQWLALAQHHGLPTRLLDWTYSPFVALHFATCDTQKYNCDGAIWLVNYKKVHDALPIKFSDAIKKEGSYVFTVTLLSKTAANLQEFDNSLCPFALFFEPPSLDERIVNQSALHSIISTPTMQFDQLLSGHPDWYKKIIVPKQLKAEIRDKLDQANITERVLFPGLDGLSKWLTRWYGPGYLENQPTPENKS
jgi:hypothetical protein